MVNSHMGDRLLPVHQSFLASGKRARSWELGHSFILGSSFLKMLLHEAGFVADEDVKQKISVAFEDCFVSRFTPAKAASHSNPFCPTFGSHLYLRTSFQFSTQKLAEMLYLALVLGRCIKDPMALGAFYGRFTNKLLRLILSPFDFIANVTALLFSSVVRCMCSILHFGISVHLRFRISVHRDRCWFCCGVNMCLTTFVDSFMDHCLGGFVNITILFCFISFACSLTALINYQAFLICSLKTFFCRGKCIFTFNIFVFLFPNVKVTRIT